jgi:hypothetical protein
MLRRSNGGAGHFTHGNVKQIHPNSVDNIAVANQGIVNSGRREGEPERSVFKDEKKARKQKLKFQRD